VQLPTNTDECRLCLMDTKNPLFIRKEAVETAKLNLFEATALCNTLAGLG